MKLIAFIIPIFIFNTNTNAWYNHSMKIHEAKRNLLQYVNSYPSRIPFTYSSCSIYIGSHSTGVNTLVNYFLQINNYCGNVILGIENEAIYGDSSKYTVSEGDFIFVDSLSVMLPFLEAAIPGNIWNPQGDTHIITLEPNDKIIDYVRLFWSKQLYKYVIVLLHDNLKVLKYNPFIDVLSDVTNSDCLYISEYISNMHLTPLLISTYNIESIFNEFQGVIWTDNDIEVTEDVIKMLNATPYYVKDDTLEEVMYDINNSISDVCLHPLFLHDLQIHEDDVAINYIYSTANKIVVVLPRGKPKINILNLFRIFDLPTWLILIFLLFLFAAWFTIISKLHKHNKSFTMWLMESYKIYIQSPISIHNKPKYLKLSLTAWILFTLINNIVFQTNLFGAFVQKVPQPEINTLQEIRDQKIELVSRRHHVKDVSLVFPNNVVLGRNLTAIHALFMAQNNTYGFVLEYQIAVMYTTLMKDRDNTPLYYIVDETVYHGYNVYMVRNYSPYGRSIKRIIHLRREYTTSNLNVIHLRNNNKSMQVITLEELFGIFVVYLLGQSVALMVFIIELLKNHMCKGKKDSRRKQSRTVRTHPKISFRH